MVTGSTAEIKFSPKQDVTGHKEGAKNMAPLLFWGQGRMYGEPRHPYVLGGYGSPSQ